jgi:VCBS repeat-containing protein
VKRLNISGIIVYIVFSVSLLFLSSCSGTSDNQEVYGQGTGSIAFSLLLPTEPVTADGTGPMYKAAQLDCDGLGIVTVEALVYDENENVIAQGGPWDCNVGEGIIYEVPAGNNRIVFIFLRDENHIIQYSGNKSQIQVFAGQTTDAGTIIVIEGEEEDNHLPLAVDDSASVVRGGEVQGNVLENDSDADGDILGAALVTEPVYGTVSLNEDGNFIYTHNGSNESSSDSFTYEATDGRGGSATADVNIAVLLDPVDNHAPVAGEDSASVVRGGRVQGNVLDNDYDVDGDTLGASLISEPGYGSVSLNENGTFIYIHNGSSESSSDSYTYEVADGRGGSATAVVNITVLLNPVDNHAPSLANAGVTPISGDETETFTYTVFYSDIDGHAASDMNAVIDGEPHVMTLSSGSPYEGTYTYQTSLEPGGHDFYFDFSDGYDGTARLPENGAYTGPDVEPLNHAPTAEDDSASVVRGGRVQGNVLDNDYDVDGDSLNAYKVSEPVYGSVSLDEDGTFIYTHDGNSESSSDSFSYEATDGRGGSATAVVNIFILLDPLDNHSPVLSDGKVTPGAGHSTEIFTYTVYYSDIDGHSASDRNVVIDGEPHVMTLSSGSPWEGTYTYQTSLEPGGHDYYFDFSDGYEGTARLPEAKTFYGPHVALVAYFVAPPPYGNDENDGSANEPFATIGHAIEIAQGEENNPGTIYVSVGMFEENLVLDAWETIMGGWSVDFSQRWDFVNNGADPTEEYRTVLDGGGIERCMSIIEVDGVVIDGMTIFNGRSVSSDTGGSGIYISTCSPVIVNCSMLNNSNTSDQPYGYGGGIYCYASDPIISNCIFSQNSAVGTFSYGGGMYNYYSDPIITNCVFIQNNALGISFSAGGAICNNMSNPIITNCTFSLNVSSSELSKGGGICNISSVSVITNSILWGDTAMYGSEIYNICETECEITFCDIDQALSVNDRIHDNIRQNPLFVDPDGGDLHIDFLSPCIDAGTNNAPWLLQTDFDGDTRIINEVVDMGADEFVEYVQ